MTRAAATTSAPLLDGTEINTLIDAATTGTGAAPQTIRQGSRSGELSSRQPGAGTDAADLRNYFPGDDTRHIDWRASARSTTTMLRTWHADQRNPFVVLLDRGATMRFGSQRRLKVTQAVRAALTLLAREAHAGREVGALMLDHPAQWIPPAAGMQGLMRLIPSMVAAAPPTDADTPECWRNAITELIQRLDEDTDVVLISDFLTLGDKEERLLLALGQRLHARAIQISDPLEQQPGFPFPVTLSWGAQTADVGAADAPALTLLAAAQTRHQRWLESSCRKAGISYQQLSTTQDALSTLP